MTTPHSSSSAQHHYHQPHQQHQHRHHQQHHNAAHASDAAAYWSILHRHAREEIMNLRLETLCCSQQHRQNQQQNEDNDGGAADDDDERLSSLVVVYNTTTTPSPSSPYHDDDDDDAIMREDKRNNNNNSDTQQKNQTNRMLIVDLSRQKMTMETIHLLYKYALSGRQLRRYIHHTLCCFGGHSGSDGPSLYHHMALRVPTVRLKQHRAGHSPSTNNNRIKGFQYQDLIRQSLLQQRQRQERRSQQSGGRENTDTTAATPASTATTPPTLLNEIQDQQDRIRRLADAIRDGRYHGMSGTLIENVVVVGHGTAIAALQFIYKALSYDEDAVLASQMGLSAGGGMSSASLFTSSGSSSSMMMETTIDDVGASSSSEQQQHRQHDTSSSSAQAAARMIRRNLQSGAASILGSAAEAMAANAGGNAASRQAQQQQQRRRTIRFVTSLDPLAIMDTISDLDPAATLVISVALEGNEPTGLATKTIKSWLLASAASARRAATNNSMTRHTIRPEQVLAKHMILITGNTRIATAINKPGSVFLIPQQVCHCEALASFSAVTLLPLAVTFGWDCVTEFMNGGYDLDRHLLETKPRYNLPILMALADMWNDVLVGSSEMSSTPAVPSGRIVTPYTHALSSYPAFVAALESSQRDNGNAVDSRGSNDDEDFGYGHHHHTFSSQGNKTLLSNNAGAGCTGGLVIDGGMMSLCCHNSIVTSPLMNSELVTTMDSQLAFNLGNKLAVGGAQQRQHPMTMMMGTSNGATTNNNNDTNSSNQMMMDQLLTKTQDSLMCQFFARADELAFGRSSGRTSSSSDNNTSADDDEYDEGGPPSITNNNLLDDNRDGNRSSVLLICDRIDAFTCGQLVALAEHRAMLKSYLSSTQDDASVSEETTTETTFTNHGLERSDQYKDVLQHMFVVLQEDEQHDGAGGQHNDRSVDDQPDDEIMDGATTPRMNGNDAAMTTMMMNPSTKTILRHYAGLARQQKNRLLQQQQHL